MLNLSRKIPPIAATIPPQPQRPVARMSQVGSQSLGAYEALAKELGFMPAQLLEEQLRRFLNENRIPIYADSEVDAYLAAIAEKEGKAWIWRPLRERDIADNFQIPGRISKVGNVEFRHGCYYYNSGQFRPYNKAVPIHILRHVKKIQDRFGDSLKFFVSDYAVPNPDPFIMVTALDVPTIIFGVWDEPGFGTE